MAAPGKNKTLHGVWLTPTPVEWVDDPEMDGKTPDGVFCYKTERGHMKMRVEKKKLKSALTGAGFKVERIVTLEEGDSGFTCKGKANITYDRITFRSGAIWCRQIEKPPDQQAEVRPAIEVQEEAVHEAAPFCGFFCGSKQKPEREPDEPAPLLDGAAAEAELPPPKSLQTGFFNDEQVEGIVERINDVVGIWGISEEREAEFIRPAVAKLNKVIHVAMKAFLDNPIIDLFQCLMDAAMDAKLKALALGRYLHDRFIEPLTTSLMELLAEEYRAVALLQNKVQTVVSMMSQMVTDELMGKMVEQVNDAEVEDLDEEETDA